MMPWVVKSMLNVVPAGAIDGPAHLVPVNPTHDKNTMWVVNTHIDVDTWGGVFDHQLWQHGAAK